MPDALDARRRPGEILVHHVAVEADGLKDLRAAIALDGRDAHLGHRLDHAFDGGLDVFLDGGLVVELDQQALANHVVERLERQIRIDGAATVADEQREMMHLARFAGFEHEADLAARALRGSDDDAGRPPPAARESARVCASTPRSDRIRMFAPPAMAWSAAANSFSSAVSRPFAPSAAGNKIGSVTALESRAG